MEIGIIGLPFSGKTTMFATLTGQEISQIHTGSKVEAHRGVVKVQDDRLDYLATIFKPKKKVNTTIEYLDVGGVESDTSQKIGFDAQFLAILKNTDALCLVIRAFEDEMYPHPDGSINVLRDLQNVETEFILSDLSIVEGRIERLEKQIAKQKSEEAISDLELMRKFKEHLETEKPLREFELSAEESFKIRGFQFLSVKPLIVTVNYEEEGIVGEANILKDLNEYRNKKSVIILGLCGKIEYEISKLSDEDRELFLNEMQISESAIDKMVRKSYEVLSLITFFTVVHDECRAWTIPNCTNIRKAAGIIHSDMERGFIRAEVINYDKFVEMGSMARCREQGLLRLEGKEYIVQDGDIVSIRFNV